MSVLTAGEVIARIKANLGVPWQEKTYRDTFKFGGPETGVKGIATTMFCTYEVMQRAVAAGCNMVIAHEPTYWNDSDSVKALGDDPFYKKKTDYMREHDMAVFRFHDHAHAHRPDFIFAGTVRALGLASYEAPPQSRHYTLPETTLGELAASFQKKLGDRAMRVVGDPKEKVSRMLLGVGYGGAAVNEASVDVVVSGEQQETDGGFDSPAYVVDAMTLGVAKGWIMLGHVASEQEGMLEVGDWVRSFTPEVPVKFLRTGEPFWVPK